MCQVTCLPLELFTLLVKQSFLLDIGGGWVYFLLNLHDVFYEWWFMGVIIPWMNADGRMGG